MKKIFIISATLCLSVLVAHTQPNYPTAPPAVTPINAIEYFVDAKPFFGAATALTGYSSNPNINAFNGTVTISGVPSGFHRFYIRSKDANGVWSHTNNSFFDNYNIPLYAPAPLALSNITTIEYFVDTKLEFGTATALTGYTSSTNVSGFNGTTTIAALPSGFHRFYIRSKDATGKWSLTNNAYFDNYNIPVYNAAPTNTSNIVAIEYFIDANPTFGSGTPITGFTANTSIVGLNANINVTGLPQGVHRLYIRSKDANNKWSITNFSVFDNSLTPNYPTAPATAPAIANMEYYIDADPGFGAATPLTVPGNTGNIGNYTINLNLSGSLSVGTHYLYIRSKQNPWSLTTVVPFSATTTTPVSWLFVKAQLLNNQTSVSWATASETNTKNFEVEWSSDGLNFTKLGIVNAAGNSSTITNYSYNHSNPVTGFNYYRIKQIDLDGSYKYSVIVKVLLNKNIKETIVAPNPVQDVINVIEPTNSYIQTAELYDSKGTLVLRKTLNETVQVYSIPVHNLASGNYVLKVKYKNNIKSYTIIKD